MTLQPPAPPPTDASRVYGDDDADFALIQDRNVAVLGYDDDARAQALCLRDSGVDVRVGVVPGSAGHALADDDGLRVVAPYEACEEADLLVLTSLGVDERTVTESVLPNLVPGDAVVLGAATVLSVDVPPGVDAVRMVPWSDAVQVRREYTRGRGVPLFATVVSDGSGDAWPLALSYARAIGGTRAGVLAVSDAAYGAARRAVEHDLAGAVMEQVRHTLDVLLQQGCPPELAYVECTRGLQRVAAELAAGRLDEVLEQPRTGRP